MKRILKIPSKSIGLARKLKNLDGGREISHYMKQMGLSHLSSIYGVKLLKKTFNPIKAIQRKRPANDTIGVKGYTKLHIEGASELAKYCADLFEKKKDKVMADFQPPYGFVLNYLETGQGVELENPEEFKPIIDFCLKPEIFDLVSGYIGEAPVISNVSLVYTMPNSTKIGPQLFHIDANEYKQLHLVMPVWEVDEESGPFTFLPADKSAILLKKIKHNGGRIADEVIFSHFSESDLIKCLGKPGDFYVLNPCQCVHFGARTKSKARLLLIVNMTSAFEGGEGLHAVYRANNRSDLYDGSKNSKLLLNL